MHSSLAMILTLIFHCILLGKDAAPQSIFLSGSVVSNNTIFTFFGWTAQLTYPCCQQVKVPPLNQERLHQRPRLP